MGRVNQAVAETSSSEMISRKGGVFMILLALQFGCQPLLQKACIPKNEVNRISLILAIEVTKISLCAVVILSLGLKACRSMIESWTLRRSLQAAAVPAAGYALQNWLTQCAYANLDSLTFNLLNQTKTLFAALCLYLVMGKRQSRTQLVALSLLLGAALLLNAGNHDNGNSNSSSGGGLLVNSGDGVGTFERLWLGVLPVLCASFLSGLFGVVTQRTLQTGYNSFQLSLELAVYGAASVLLAYALGDASYSGGTQGLFQGWTPLTFVPVLSQAAGGVIVGQVTKHAGSVQKGFSLIAGILVTAVVQIIVEDSKLTRRQWTAAALVAGATYLHANFPYRQLEKHTKID